MMSSVEMELIFLDLTQSSVGMDSLRIDCALFWKFHLQFDLDDYG